jgi:hypothetical protein
VNEHIAFYEEWLPHLLFGDLTDFVLAARAAGDTGTVRAVLNVLDSALASSDDYVVNLIGVSFVENVEPSDPEMATFIASWPDRLRAAAERQRNWRPST